MTDKKYHCGECGYTYPSELSELIDKRIQVFCEKCGTPFTIKGVNFKPFSSTPEGMQKARAITDNIPPSGYQRFPSGYPHKFHYRTTERDLRSIENAIQGFNKFSYFLIYIISFVIFGLLIFDILRVLFNVELITYPLLFNFLSRGFFGLGGIFIAQYDQKYISKKVNEKRYNEIVIDAFCFGILGSIYYGIGVFLLLKGILILIYNILKRKNFAYNLKDSFNHFSAKAGFIIVLLIVAFSLVVPIKIEIGPIVQKGTIFELGLPYILTTLILTLIGISMLIIDMIYGKKLKTKEDVQVGDAIPIFIIGIIGVAGYASGIFILLKGILMILICIFQPKKTIESKIEIEEKIPEKKVNEPILKQPVIAEIPPSSPPPELPKELELTKQEEKMIKAHVKKTEKLKKELEKAPTPEKKFELKLHESLLPVSDEKDKELIKQYFTRIFSVLSKDVKNQIKNLKISKKEKKELLEELAFLTIEEQAKYIESVINMYQEIPKKLINRIRKLPNVKPKHYDKIIDQLKYLDSEEQLKFVQFLEENA